mgnify:FL=1
MRETRSSRFSHVSAMDDIIEMDGCENTRLKAVVCQQCRCFEHGLDGANWEDEGPLSLLGVSFGDHHP